MIQIYRSQQNKTLTGTLGGLSEYFGIDYTWLRIAFVLLCVITYGAAIIAYMILALIMRGRTKTKRSRRAVNYLKYMFIHLKTILSDSKYAKLFAICFFIMGSLWFLAEKSTESIILLTIAVVLFVVSLRQKSDESYIYLESLSKKPN